jgi:hypothetical protein
MEEGKGEVEEGEEGEGGRALQKKKKGLTWGCVNSWLLRNRPLFYSCQPMRRSYYTT